MRHSQCARITATASAYGITLGLFEDILRIYRHLPCLDDAKQFSADERSVVGRAARHRQLLDDLAVERREVEALTVTDDFPRGIRRTQLGVDALLPGLPLRFVHAVVFVPGRKYTNDKSVVGRRG